MTFGLPDDTNEPRRGSGMGAADIDAMLGPMTMLGHGTRVNVTCGLVPG